MIKAGTETKVLFWEGWHSL